MRKCSGTVTRRMRRVVSTTKYWVRNTKLSWECQGSLFLPVALLTCKVWHEKARQRWKGSAKLFILLWRPNKLDTREDWQKTCLVSCHPYVTYFVSRSIWVLPDTVAFFEVLKRWHLFLPCWKRPKDRLEVQHMLSDSICSKQYLGTWKHAVCRATAQ